ncbi:hypothetical protein BSZ20_00335 [Bradyrhizobium canariense]|nr:hypothetical protein A1Q_4543 [Vibrio campbellii HY01]OSI58433.1 hypothetical protein BSZ20_00335 [Bradyrhizobium canariense]QJT70768.1 hypothetical protein [Vibrio phage HY01]
MIVIAVLVGLLFISDSQTQKARESLSQASSELAAERAKLDVAIAFNTSQNETIKSLNQQLVDAQVADEWMRKFNVSMDTKLKTTMLELGKIFDEEAKSFSPGCDDRFSDGVTHRMQQYYQSRKGSGVPD